MATPMTFAIKSLRQARELMDLSQREVGSRMDLSQSMISKLEAVPLRNTSYETAKKYTDALCKQSTTTRFQLEKRADNTVRNITMVVGQLDK